MGKDVIIALDFDSREKTLAFLDQFTGRKPFVKIGMELFYAEGPSIVRTPGIRFADSKADDQVRITTPARAREIGSDYIVVGRPITQAADPVAAYLRCAEEFVG